MCPKVTVVVPVYNVERYLRPCVDSLLNQTFTDFEILLIDDGSPDNSGKICDEYTRTDTRVRVFHKKNGGVSSARNMGIERALGKWIMFVDSDDMLVSSAFERCLQLVEGGELDYLSFGFSSRQNVVPTETLNPLVFTSTLEFLDTHTVTSACGGIIKRDIIVNNDIRFREGMKYGEDTLFILQVLCNSCRMMQISDELYYYRPNEQSVMHNPNIDAMLSSCRVFISEKGKHKVLAHQLDNSILYLITECVSCKDYRKHLDEILEVYQRAHLSYSDRVHTIGKLFYKISLFSPRLGILVYRFLVPLYNWYLSTKR